MFKVSKVVFAIAACVLFFAACRERRCDDGSLSPEELEWIPYAGGQQVIFFSAATQQYDTAIAQSAVHDWRTGQSYDQDCNGPHGTEAATQQLVFSSRTIPFEVLHDYDRTPTGARVGPLEIPEASSGSMTINGHTYSDVRIAQYDSAACVDLFVWRYYVNKEFGLLRFDQKNGPSWELSR